MSRVLLGRNNIVEKTELEKLYIFGYGNESTSLRISRKSKN